MKKLVKYILEKQGYVDQSIFVDEIISTISKDIESSISSNYYIDEWLTPDREQQIKDYIVERNNYELKKLIHNLHQFLHNKIFIPKEYVFIYGKNHNPAWMDKCIISSGLHSDSAAGMLDTDKCGFDNGKFYCQVNLYSSVLSFDPTNISKLQKLIDLPIIRRSQICDGLTDILSEWVEGAYELINRYRITLVHELAHAFDEYMFRQKTGKSLEDIYFTLTDSYGSSFEELLHTIGYLMNKTELNANMHQLIYACKKGDVDRNVMNSLYEFIRLADNAVSPDDYSNLHNMMGKYIWNFYYSFLVSLMYPIITLLEIKMDAEKKKYPFDKSNAERALQEANNTKVFKVFFGRNKDIETLDELVDCINKAYNIYKKKFINILNTASKHLVS